MKTQKRKTRHSQQRLVVPRRDRARELAAALATISSQLVSVGLGDILLGRLARHILKLRKKVKQIKR